MGYRTNIGKISKRDYNKIKSLTKEEFFSLYKIENMDDRVDRDKFIINLEYISHDFKNKIPKKSFKKFFKKDCLNEVYDNSDTELKIATKEFFEFVINDYKLKIVSWYERLLSPYMTLDSWNMFQIDTLKIPEIKSEEFLNAFIPIIEHLRNNHHEWGSKFSFFEDNLKRDDLKVTNSLKYEYSIFELIRIYKSFNWKKDILVYYGY